MKIFILMCLTAAFADATTVYDVVMDEWRYYKASTKRSYRSAEEEYVRLKTFLKSKDLIAKHNAKYANSEESYKLSLNHLADKVLFDDVGNVTSRFFDETEETLRTSPAIKLIVPENPSLPDSVDWVAKGAVTPPKSQGACGCCYAVTTAGIMESYVYMKSKKLSDLSFQQIIDCSQDFGNDGCDGGTFSSTFKYLKTTGLASASDYPYEASVGACRSKGKVLTDSVKKYYHLSRKSEEDLKYALATFGPVAIGINASPRTFQLYSQGVYSDPSCDGTLVHAVLLVGYGTDKKTNQDYWTIKNSWGTDWGENGYIRVARNRGLCGMGKLAYFGEL